MVLFYPRSDPPPPRLWAGYAPGSRPNDLTTGEKPCVLLTCAIARYAPDLTYMYFAPHSAMTSQISSQNRRNTSTRFAHLKIYNQPLPVMMRDFSYRRQRSLPTFNTAEIVRKTGPVSYEVESANKTYRRHADQLTSTQATGRVTTPCHTTN